ncbi:MAG: Putative DNA-binding protein in cluster with Type I restriction-modification system [uncultured Campylobacterales bacterium]|uniref:DNA-binding protein in cluster with Type I restriction-modification system n=1 Tax=uncultured Campylobacterales bacterium TaxID=352960 RepID=A0A6S6T787_9BACT|nr:MAG: Putative DNA-binding protein in cluster with Type I restriction-modification system [uncultured Campylobacterales bacterium]
MSKKNNFLIYQNEKGNIKIDVKFEDKTIWLNQTQICELFGKAKSTISEHIKAILEEEELDVSTIRNYRTVQTEGSREVARTIDHYNLDMIIAIGFRVRSSTGTKFRLN